MAIATIPTVDDVYIANINITILRAIPPSILNLFIHVFMYVYQMDVRTLPRAESEHTRVYSHEGEISAHGRFIRDANILRLNLSDSLY